MTAKTAINTRRPKLVPVFGLRRVPCLHTSGSKLPSRARMGTVMARNGGHPGDVGSNYLCSVSNRLIIDPSCRHRMLTLCESHGVGCIIGLGKNAPTSMIRYCAGTDGDCAFRKMPMPEIGGATEGRAT